jgi:hypothetical protein
MGCFCLVLRIDDELPEVVSVLLLPFQPFPQTCTTEDRVSLPMVSIIPCSRLLVLITWHLSCGREKGVVCYVFLLSIFDRLCLGNGSCSELQSLLTREANLTCMSSLFGAGASTQILVIKNL